MATFLDYVRENGRKSFEELPLNSLDLAVLNELGYLPFGETFDLRAPMSLQAMREQFQVSSQKLSYSYAVNKQRVALLKAVLGALRYADLQVSHYINEVDFKQEMQFAAMVMRLPSIKHAQIVFRGTDETLIGWKEDLKLFYLSEIPAQACAKTYLPDILKQEDGDFVLTGHSKGGNLAIYAAANLPKDYQMRLKKIISYDSPGFHQTFLTSDGFKEIKKKICLLRPKFSVAGSILNHGVFSHFVESRGLGMTQHDVASWQIEEQDWQVANGQTIFSRVLEESFEQWRLKHTEDELENLFDSSFALLLDRGVTDLDEVMNHPFKQTLATLWAFMRLKRQKRRQISQLAKSFFWIMLGRYCKALFNQLCLGASQALGMLKILKKE